jgi:hypothetical protein
MKKILVAILCLSLTGCATIRRHPVVTGLVVGAAAGAVIGYEMRVKHCTYTYDGQPYSGTTCPAPKN